MKGRSIFGLMVSLAVLGAYLVTRQPSATAAPAPIFRPLIRDIQNQLPRNLVFRLPSNLPASATRWGNPKIEFRVDSDSATLKITYVGCERDFQPGGRGYAINCIPFSVYSSTLSSQRYRERPRGNVFNLNSHLQAYHFQGDGFSIISWIQDGIYFEIYSPSVSYNELIQVARSMANEPPIYNIATANEVYLDNNCRRNQALAQEDRFILFYRSQFRANNQDYWFYAGRYQDGAAIFCISRPNFSNPKPLSERLEIQYHFIESIVKVSNMNAAFIVTVREGNGSGVPLTDYRLNLSNPNRPVLTRLRRRLGRT